jgi:hypothetical protein
LKLLIVSKKMEAAMKKFLLFLAFLCVILLVMALPLALLGFDVGRVIFNPPLLTRVTTEIVTESDLIPAALAWYSQSRAEQRYASGQAAAGDDEPDVALLMDFMTIEDWRVIRWEVLTNEILADWVSVTIAGVYDWIDSEEAVPQITWSMKALIERVNSEHGTNAITVAYAALPPCSQAQIEDFESRLAAVPAGQEVLYNLCEFPDPWREDQFGDYVESLDDLVSAIPDHFGLTDELARVEDTEGAGIETIKAQLRFIRLAMKLAPVVPLVLFFLILAFAVRSLKGLGRWEGIPLLLGGLIALAAALTYRPLFTMLLSSTFLSEVPELVKAEAIAAVLRLAAEAFRPMMWQALALTALGLALLVIGALSRPKAVETQGD